MDSGQVLMIFQYALILAFKIAGPFLIASILVGLVISIFQAATQIHEQTLTFVPKVLIIALMLLFLGSWSIKLMNEFFELIFTKISGI